MLFHHNCLSKVENSHQRLTYAHQVCMMLFLCGERWYSQVYHVSCDRVGREFAMTDCVMYIHLRLTFIIKWSLFNKVREEHVQVIHLREKACIYSVPSPLSHDSFCSIPPPSQCLTLGWFLSQSRMPGVLWVQAKPSPRTTRQICMCYHTLPYLIACEMFNARVSCIDNAWNFDHKSSLKLKT